MVGNVIEFVADWGPLATTGTTWDVFIPGFGGDVSNMGGSPNGDRFMDFPARRCEAAALHAEQRRHRRVGRRLCIDQNGAPNSIGDATAAGFRCAK